MGWDTVLEVVIVGVVVSVLLYGISWWRGRGGLSVLNIHYITGNNQGSLFRLVNRKVGGLFSREK